MNNDPFNSKDPSGMHSCGKPPCPDIAPSSAKVLEAGVQTSEKMSVAEGASERGAIVLISKNDESVRTLTGKDAGKADERNPSGTFRFRFKMDKSKESVGQSVHSHPKADRSGVMRRQAAEKDASNEFPSSTDLKQTMNVLNAPVLIKTPSGALREAYRMGGIDHLRTIREGSVPLGPIPADINDNFVVDP